jgi:hypothetical protein
MSDKQESRDNLRANLLPGAISAGGFLGADPRSLAEIIAADAQTVANCGTSDVAIAARLRQLTAAGEAGLGRPVLVDGHLEVTVSDTRGLIACPFADGRGEHKRLTSVVDCRTGRSLGWSDLNIHLIECHGFYEGKGAAFRVEPLALAEILGLARTAKY